MPTVYVVPHTEATHHIDGLVGGWYDSELTERGRDQAQAATNALAKLISNQPRIYSSDLKRAIQTAEPIAAHFDVPVITTSDLREISCGIAEGKPQNWLSERISHPPATGARMDHPIIKGAETRRDICLRIHRFLDQLLGEDFDEAVLVTHGFATTFIIAAWIGMPLDATGYVDFDVDSGSVTVLKIDPTWGNRTLKSLNLNAHLASI